MNFSSMLVRSFYIENFILYQTRYVGLLGIFSLRMKYKIYGSLKYALKTIISISRKATLNVIHTYLEIVIPFQIRKIKYIVDHEHRFTLVRGNIESLCR